MLAVYYIQIVVALVYGPTKYPIYMDTLKRAVT